MEENFNDVDDSVSTENTEREDGPEYDLHGMRVAALSMHDRLDQLVEEALGLATEAELLLPELPDDEKAVMQGTLIAALNAAERVNKGDAQIVRGF